MTDSAAREVCCSAGAAGTFGSKAKVWLEKLRGEDHQLTLAARRALAELYRAWGRPKEALSYSR